MNDRYVLLITLCAISSFMPILGVGKVLHSNSYEHRQIVARRTALAIATPLFRDRARRSSDLDIVSQSVPARLIDEHGEGVLHWLARSGDTASFIVLFSNGNLSTRFPYPVGEGRRSPFFLAYSAGHLPIARLLLKAYPARVIPEVAALPRVDFDTFISVGVSQETIDMITAYQLNFTCKVGR